MCSQPLLPKLKPAKHNLFCSSLLTKRGIRMRMKMWGSGLVSYVWFTLNMLVFLKNTCKAVHGKWGSDHLHLVMDSLWCLYFPTIDLPDSLWSSLLCSACGSFCRTACTCKTFNLPVVLSWVSLIRLYSVSMCLMCECSVKFWLFWNWLKVGATFPMEDNTLKVKSGRSFFFPSVHRLLSVNEV